MAKGNSHPYIPSPGMLVQAFTQLRSMFPSSVDANTLKKLSIAPKNESMVLNSLRFLGFIDENGNKTKTATDVFNKHKEDEFAKSLESVVKSKYESLFENYGDRSWSLDRDSLINFFRVEDDTSALTAKRQAIAFETLSALSGHGETPTARSYNKKEKSTSNREKKTNNSKSSTSKSSKTVPKVETLRRPPKDVGLTVRIEINLPAQGDQETYDRIFKSIKANLLND